ncbi:pentapeptide repeat-containing protein [Elusimicrobiota bacterium]
MKKSTLLIFAAVISLPAQIIGAEKVLKYHAVFDEKSNNFICVDDKGGRGFNEIAADKAKETKNGECADLSRKSFYMTDLSEANFKGANLSGSDLTSANLIGSDLRGANLAQASLFEAMLRGADLRFADLTDTKPKPYYMLKAKYNMHTKLPLTKEQIKTAGMVEVPIIKLQYTSQWNEDKKKFLCADKEGNEGFNKTSVEDVIASKNGECADLSKTKLKGADLSGANLKGADLSKADLYNANLHKADLGWANLKGAKLAIADMRGSYLMGADLRKTDIRTADVGKAQYDSNTKLPFSAKKAKKLLKGLININEKK